MKLDAGILSALRAIVRVAREGAAVREEGGAVTRKHGSTPEAADSEIDEAFIAEVEPLLEFLWSRYFRVRLIGIENVPEQGPALLVANHSGGLPYDGTLLMHGVRRFHPRHRRLRALVASFAFRSRLMAPIVSRYGGVRASVENGVRLLRQGELVAAFPEGLRGVGKLYRERYRLTRFGRGGFVRLALQTGAPIIPVAIVGAEEIHPVIGKLHGLARPLGVPYIPITPTFPFLGPLGLLPLPTKWTIQIGNPIAVPVGGNPPGLSASSPDSTEAFVLETAETVRDRIDGLIANLLLDRRSIFRG